MLLWPMRCTIPGRGIRGEILYRPLNCYLCSLLPVNVSTLSALIFFQLLEKLSCAWQRLEMSCILKPNLME